MSDTKIWSCKIGEVPVEEFGEYDANSPKDPPMRMAIRDAYVRITGREPDFIFSGWGAELTEPERAVVENRDPE